MFGKATNSASRRRGLAALVLVAVAVGPRAAGAQSPQGSRSGNPRLGSAVVDLLEAPPLPAITVSPTRRHALLVRERGLLSLQSLAEPMVEVAGLRLDPRTYGPHAPLAYYGLTLVDLPSGSTVEIPLPPDAIVGFPRWSPDGSRFAFTLTHEGGIELWVGDTRQHRARPLVGAVLNAATSNPCTWMPDGRRLLCRTVPRDRRSADPVLMSAGTPAPGQAAPAAGRLERAVAAQLLESQLVLIDARSGSRRAIGFPTAFESVEPAPSGAYLLVQRMKAPYPDVTAGARPKRALEIWDITGRLIRAFGVEDAAPRARAVQWRASAPATVVWAEASEDGDRLLAQAAPFAAAPVELFRPAHGFAGLMWLADSSAALVRDFDPGARTTSQWLVDAAAPAAPARLLFTRSIDSPHAVATPLTHVNARGGTVVTTDGGGIFLHGEDVEGGTVHQVLERLNLRTRARTRLWESSSDHYEPVVDLLAGDGSSVLTRRESVDDPPNYVVHDLARGLEHRVTDYRHPAPSLLAARRIPLHYTRGDGRELSSILYVPGSADASRPLPVVMWAYPREFGTEPRAPAASTAERFPSFERAFRLFFLLRGYAVMDQVAMPIVGDPGQANDTFIEQVVDNARAALAAAADTGLVDTGRAGIAGHSYGAFMVANLLAHSRLFGAGVAMSGAYNRTLTPYGFQTERRSLWDARELYLAMSPFLYSNQIDAPLLLVHGLQDDNAGTRPMQSQQFYNAIRYNGGRAELLLLPFEGHNYRARESVLRTADSMLAWFDRYLKTGDAAKARTDRFALSDEPAGLGENESTSLCSRC